MNARDWVIVFVLVIIIFLISHVSVDKDFDKNYKIGFIAVVSVFVVLYLAFGFLGGR